ncbi:MAG: hypothetical protein DYG92_00160 [Leptolyngbya sp. PLA1]|nr:hypothetical protein [Leptolyngbya sp. PLA1]
MRGALRVGLVMAILACGTTAASAQAVDSPEWLRKLAIDPDSPEARTYAAHQRARLESERQLRRLRMQHFGPIKKTEVRQEGLVKLREFNSPALFPTMLEVFEREGPDVKNALLDLFDEDQTDQGVAAMTWMGIFDSSAEARSLAEARVRARAAKAGRTPLQTKLVVFEGLRSHDQSEVSRAAKFAAGMDILEAIPWLIAGQVQGVPQQQTASVGLGQRTGALAWILVGKQTAYVSDLQPVVGPSAVAFDPQLSTVTEGVILRVLDAVVITYHVDIHNALVDLTSRSWGQSTEPLGWNVPAWHKWYRETYLPYLAEKQALAAAQPASTPASAPPTK